MNADIDRQVRAMTRPQRVEYLREHGWTRIGSGGAQSWRHPDVGHVSFSLAAAIRAELGDGRKVRRCPPDCDSCARPIR